MILFHPTTIKHYSKLGLLVLIAIDTLLALIYFISALTTGEPLTAFNFDRKWSIPVVYSAIQLLVIGICLVIAAFRKKRSAPLPSRWFLLAVGVGFLDLFIEKLFKFHSSELPKFLNSLDWMPRFPGGGGSWIFIYVPAGIIIILLGYRDLIALWKAYPKGTFITVLGVVLSFAGGVFLDFIYYLFLQVKFAQMAESGNSLALILSTLKITLEEFLEMFGESITLYGLSLFLVKRLERNI
ncbi:hypothetical protein IQ264_06545 [Phormidium sp. LEGE 05292]|uniref:hypothetical protein n=1 Tax=[Phormidium] sp. LEGE 05292 TaxID=767427 RepID=UPI001880AE0F|nr:hypothetical protein [Phormidium sp. LEGE 05292]MBE9225095.1 hypothetical protein [Phormidium sp. LEGE 05292]